MEYKKVTKVHDMLIPESEEGWIIYGTDEHSRVPQKKLTSVQEVTRKIGNVDEASYSGDGADKLGHDLSQALICIENLQMKQDSQDALIEKLNQRNILLENKIAQLEEDRGEKNKTYANGANNEQCNREGNGDEEFNEECANEQEGIMMEGSDHDTGRKGEGEIADENNDKVDEEILRGKTDTKCTEKDKTNECVGSDKMIDDDGRNDHSNLTEDSSSINVDAIEERAKGQEEMEARLPEMTGNAKGVLDWEAFGSSLFTEDRRLHTEGKGKEKEKTKTAVETHIVLNKMMEYMLTPFDTRGKVSGYFGNALIHRLYFPGPSRQIATTSSSEEDDNLYCHFYEACPYLKAAHFTANHAILKAFEGHDRVHVIDLGLMQGQQWPTFIKVLALRPGGPPFLRMTGIGLPSPDGRESLLEVGLRLNELAQSLCVGFDFRWIAASRLDDVQPCMLEVEAGEVVAVNSVFQLHRLLSCSDSGPDTFLAMIAGLNPKIVTLVEQEADHNRPLFLDRFAESLLYYSTVFDSLEAGRGHHLQQQSVEAYLEKEIWNIICYEGPGRVERHEPLGKWRARMALAGLAPVHLCSDTFNASTVMSSISIKGYCIKEVDGCFIFSWQSNPLISVSAWTGKSNVNSNAPAD